MDYIAYTTNASASIFIFYSAHQFSPGTIEATELYKRLSDQRAGRKYQMQLNSISCCVVCNRPDWLLSAATLILCCSGCIYMWDA